MLSLSHRDRQQLLGSHMSDGSHPPHCPPRKAAASHTPAIPDGLPRCLPCTPCGLQSGSTWGKGLGFEVSL